MTTERYFVVCRDDRKPNSNKGDYVFATHRIFETRQAAEHYASGVAISREPLVIEAWKNFYSYTDSLLAAK